MVGNGMYNTLTAKAVPRFTKFSGNFGVPKVLLQLNLQYAYGTHSVITSDAS